MKLSKAILGAAILVPALQFGTSASAAPVFENGTLNTIELLAYENQYRAISTPTGGDPCGFQTATPSCLAPITTGPLAGFALVNPAVANNTRVGDMFIGIMNIGRIGNSVTNPAFTWLQGLTDEFTGYFAQTVTAVNPNVEGNQEQIVTAALGTDPFGILNQGGATDEMFALFVDDAAQPGGFQSSFSFNGGGDFDEVGVANDVMNASDGTLWATLGPAPICTDDAADCTSGYSYTLTDDALTNENILGDVLVSLNLTSIGGAYNLPELAALNASGESLVGNDATSQTTGTCDPISADPITCTEFIGDAQLEINPGGFIDAGSTGGPINSPWAFRNQDPIELFPIPEPGSMALLGLALTGLGAARRRRAQ